MYEQQTLSICSFVLIFFVRVSLGWSIVPFRPLFCRILSRITFFCLTCCSVIIFVFGRLLWLLDFLIFVSIFEDLILLMNDARIGLRAYLDAIEGSLELCDVIQATDSAAVTALWLSIHFLLWLGGVVDERINLFVLSRRWLCCLVLLL